MKMNTSKYIISLFFIFLLGLLFISCKKDVAKPEADIFYTVSLDGYTVKFQNETKGAVSYKWDFGDGNTSTEASPVHAYPGKGKYVPTLYATTSDGVVTEGSTVINISKASAVKLDDNSLVDWDTVAFNAAIPPASNGIFKKGKFDYNSENIYFYFEIESTKANGDIFDFYLDTDNNASTGLVTWLFSGSGNDVLVEGAMLNDWFDVFYHKGAQNSFTFDYQTISEFYEIGTVKQEGNIMKVEGRIKRAKIKGLIGKGIKLGVTITKNDWSALLGVFPGVGAPAFYLDMSE